MVKTYINNLLFFIGGHRMKNNLKIITAILQIISGVLGIIYFIRKVMDGSTKTNPVPMIILLTGLVQIATGSYSISKIRDNYEFLD